MAAVTAICHRRHHPFMRTTPAMLMASPKHAQPRFLELSRDRCYAMIRAARAYGHATSQGLLGASLCA
eukprot:5331257-Alexandrium_andersonii.AAC.1